MLYSLVKIIAFLNPITFISKRFFKNRNQVTFMFASKVYNNYLYDYMHGLLSYE